MTHPSRPRIRAALRPNRTRLLGLLGSILLVAGLLVAVPAPKAAAACSGNAIACENQLPGTSPNVWDQGDDTTILGFATQMSVNAGGSVSFKVTSGGKPYTLDIYRLGYYQGNGARKITSLTTTVQTQPACASSTSTEIYDCGTWKVGATWSVPTTAVSGVYLAKVTLQNGDASHIPFVVRNDGNTSTVIMKTSDATWQAYNLYGGNDFYSGGANGRAYKLSYNRPFINRTGIEKRDYLFSNEYPMIRYLEQNGFDVSYVSDIDVSTDSSLLTKHKVFLSVGHDEYWSKSERANVTAARDAGVNLAFFSGNEVYWKTRLEPSQDGTNTANRTLVCYKDTWESSANAIVRIDTDPAGPTPTWRDPRYGDLGFPAENNLTGTMFMANSDDLPMTVQANEGKYRVWRNTGLDSMAGSSTTLANHLVGYESDEDVDNGYRPAGLIDMSTTTGSTPEYLQDYGKTVAPGTTTHHITLYRAASGALVFGAGTIQWAWGLDANHDGDDIQPADPRIRQATLNVLTDMGATATTLTADLTATTKSTDTTPPTVTVSSPTSGSTIAQGSLVTVSGTATDVGGRVAGVEVSVDGGASWHPAAGTTSWSYQDILTGNGANAIQVRATDDSANTSAPTSVSITSPCPCSIFGVITPTVVDGADGSAVTLGVKFTASQAGFISGIRFYKASTNTGTHTGTLYDGNGNVLATGTFSNETTSGWQTLAFANPVAITANTTYVAAYYAPKGHYSADSTFFSGRGHAAGILTAPGGSSVTNGVYANGSAFPQSSYAQTNYYVDVTYTQTNNTPTTVTAVTPSSGATSVQSSTSVTATFSKDVGSSGVTMAVQDAANNAVSGTTSYSSTSRTATFNPTQTLAAGTTYTATVSATGMAAPYQWTFTTASAANPNGSCPCSLFADSDQPSAGPDSDTVSVQLGMAFTVSQSGQITGGRFFKNVENGGTHTVSLWKGSTQLATGTATNETSSGWQSVTFSNPVAVSTGTTYVISYTAPQGRYDYTSGGLSSAITKGPLSSVSTGGRYSYGSGALTSTSSTNYYVDPVYVPSPNAAPTVVSTTPGDGATGVSVSGTVSATFSTPVQAGSAVITVKRKSDGTVISGTVSNESQGSVATFTPSSSFDPGTTYTATISGAKNLSGTAMSGSTSVSFTTAGAGACPCSLFASTTTPSLSDSGDTAAVTLGLKFSSSVNGTITGLRYYRDAANTGTHTGALWTSGGTKLAGLTFTDSGTGWQTASFSSPVSITAGTTYVASYYAPNGHYSADQSYFASPVVNTPITGIDSTYVYGTGFPTASYMDSNYYVDVVFSTSATAPPTVTAVTPTDGSTADPGVSPSATFDRAIDPTTLSMTVTAANGTLVSGTTTYASGSNTVTFAPAASLAQSTAYTVSVSATSASGVAMASPKTWTFTTTGPPPTGTPYSLFASTATPDVPAYGDNGPVLTGVRFSSSQAGSVTAIKFYAGSGNTGGQTVYLWDNSGNQLATGTASGSGVGWRTVTLGTPVAIKANTTYVVGYYGPTGHYSVTSGAFTNGYTAGPLSVPPNGATYRYPNGYPTATSNTNYWVDVVVVI
ncbi:methionine-rich copper-binding protein CopC [Friedmanniella endophytica]|uniref:Methionine-rich copper-binding protein CopC n=1 Tax=Microlunatus kandeliicorticis TaxID=1759536 RepID=A0A7W3IPB4_9ACTN|nr:DUF4082 domain-containing protein [Microlunatus kandeliicorticis]MBA8792710.1 methionine-rich copper-binding protein CopC [Microlunatus kandeliicorticis]